MPKHSLSIALAGAVGLAAAGAAEAADLGSGSMKDTGYAPPAPIWTGLRIGLNAGYGFGESYDNKAGVPADQAGVEIPGSGGQQIPTGGIPIASTNPDHFDLDGGFGGASLGYDYDFGHMVLGIEGDVELSAIEGAANSEAFFPDDPNRVTFDGNYQASIRLRLGYKLTPASLVYLTGGYAVFNTDVKVENLSAVGGAPSSSYDETFTGYTIGGGFEHMLDQNWSLRGEYRYSNFGEEDQVLRDLVPNTKVSGKVEFHAVRGGLGYKF